MCCLLNCVCVCEFLRSWHTAVRRLPPGWPQHACSSSRGDFVYQLLTGSSGSCWASIPSPECATTVRYLASLSTTLIFFWTMFGLNSAPDQTQAIGSCQSLSAEGQTFFSISLPLWKNSWLCLYIQALHSSLIDIPCEICSSCIRLLSDLKHSALMNAYRLLVKIAFKWKMSIIWFGLPKIWFRTFLFFWGLV